MAKATGQTATSDDTRFKQRLTFTIVAVVTTVIVLLVLWFTIEVFLLLFAGILLGVFLRGLARLFSEKTGLTIRWSVLVVLALLVLLGTGVWFLLASQISEQLSTLTESLPKAVANFREQIGGTEWGKWLLGQIPDGGFTLGSGSFLGSFTSFFSSTFGIIANIVFVIIIGIYLAVGPGEYRKGFLFLFPRKMRGRAGEVVDEVVQALRWWLWGQLSSMTIVGVLTAIGLTILGIPLAFSLGILAALLAFIPNFGPIISMIPPALLALMESPSHMLYVVLLYLGVQTVESYLITPQIHKRTISLPPVFTLITQILFGLLFGFPGLVLATPLAVVLLVVVKMIYVEDVIGEDVELPSEARQE